VKILAYIVGVVAVLGGFTYLIFGGATTVSMETDSTTESNPYQPSTAMVEYSAGGFEPREIKVKRGTTVDFVNRTDMPLWAASDPHPEHTDYPELDAGVMTGEHVKPGKDFQFKFDKIGTWKYHNHSVPEHTATITVTE